MSIISDGPIGGTESDEFGGMPSPLANFSMPVSREMAGPEKAAILMITLGLDLSAKLFKFLRQEEVELIVLEIAKISTVSIEKRDTVIQEAYQRAIALKYINEDRKS